MIGLGTITIAERKAAANFRKGHLARETRSDLGQLPAIAETATPAEQAAQNDAREFLLSLLANDRKRAVVHWREEKFTNEEIAAMLGTTVRSVERYLSRMRRRIDRERQQQIDGERRKGR